MASNLACLNPGDGHHLIFIDQKNVSDNLYLSCVNQWKGNPFLSVNIFEGRVKGALNKFKSRKKVFDALQKLILEIKPDEIRVGNDRRIEFQFSMNVAQKLKPSVQGAYLDEGTFTYIGRRASQSLADKYFDNFIKKLSYGRWWKNPPTVGGSDWIQKAYVAFPKLIHPLLKQKHVVPIEASGFVETQVSGLSTVLCESARVETSLLKEIDLLFCLPHESIYLKLPAYRECVMDFLSQLQKEGLRVAVKYHPRDTVEDGLGVVKQGLALSIPAKANFESLVSLLGDAIVIGDVSSVLLVTRWLRPDLSVLSIDSGLNQEAIAQFKDLYRELDIPIKSADEAAFDIIELINRRNRVKQLSMH